MPKGSVRRAAGTPLTNLGFRAEQPVWIDDEFSCDSPIEVGITLRRVNQRDYRRVDSLGDANAVVTMSALGVDYEFYSSHDRVGCSEVSSHLGIGVN